MDKDINNLIINTQEECAKEDINLDSLYLKRDELITKINENKMENDILFSLLNNVNSIICKTNGHSYDEWREIPHKYFGYYSERKCSICGMVEKEYSEEKREHSVLKKVK